MTVCECENPECECCCEGQCDCPQPRSEVLMEDDEKERLAIRTAAFDWLICKELESVLEEPFEEDKS